MPRTLCSGPCNAYFDPRSTSERMCDSCARLYIDHEAGMICQDNAEVGEFLRPVDAMSLAKTRVELAQAIRELGEWKRFARSSYSAICSIAAPRMLPKDREAMAERLLRGFEKDFPEVVAEINGPVYGEKRG